MGLRQTLVLVLVVFCLASCRRAAPRASLELEPTPDPDTVRAPGSDLPEVAGTMALSSSGSGRSVKLPVIHQRQIETGCSRDNWCCALASANMATAYIHGAAPTAAFLKKDYERLKMDACCHHPGGKGVDRRQAADVARQVGDARSTATGCYGFDEIKKNVAASRPVAVQLVYGKIPRRLRCADFTGLHMVLVVGFDEPRGTWILNDPLCAVGGSTWPSQDLRDAALAGADDCRDVPAGIIFAK